MSRMLVCGGRDYTDHETLFDTLDVFLSDHQVDTVIHGAAKGADALANKWAEYRGLTIVLYPAQWGRYGKSAGPRRNRQMLVEGRPDFVVAFPGGTGTEDMVYQAMAAAVPVYRVSRNGGIL